MEPRFKLGMIFVFIIAFMMSVTSAFAAIECYDMKVVLTGTNIVGGAQVNVVRVERGSTACGTMTTGERRTFNFSDANGDAGLATALTAYSLGNPVYLVLQNDSALNATGVVAIMVSP